MPSVFTAGEDILLRTSYAGLPQGSGAAAPVANAAAADAAAGSMTSSTVPALGEGLASTAFQEAAVLEAPPTAAEEPVLQTGEADSAQASAAVPQLAGADSAAAMELEDDVVPELPEYEDDDADDDQGTEEEVTSEQQSEPVSPARPSSGSYSAPVTPAKSGKKGWSFKRMFGSKKRGRDGGEGIDDDGGNALPTARSISASDLGASLTTPRKKKGGRLARMLGRKWQVPSDTPLASTPQFASARRL